jgi:hypothetical protein
LALREAEIFAERSVEEVLEPGAARMLSVPLGRLHRVDAETGASLGTAA